MEEDVREARKAVEVENGKVSGELSTLVNQFSLCDGNQFHFGYIL